MTSRTAKCTIAVALTLAACDLQPVDDTTDRAELGTARAEPRMEGPASAPPGSGFEPVSEPPLVLGDRFWAGEETVAYELVGEFRSAEALRVSLDPDREVGPVGGRTPELGEILVAVEYGDSRSAATWRVAGPADVVDPYVKQLREGISQRSPLIALGVLPLTVRYCCAPSAPEVGSDR